MSNLNEKQFSKHLEWPVKDFTSLYNPSEYGSNWQEVPGHRLFWMRGGVEKQTALEDSIKEEGMRDPITVNRYSMRVTDGHHRVIAALKHDKPVKFQYES